MNPRALLAAAATLAAAAPALATWSIILIDTRTGEIAVGSATCLANFDLQANTPVLLTGIGAATAQSFVDSTGQNRVYIRDRLALGWTPADILAGLATFDTGHQTRQYGITDVLGRSVTFSGTGAGAYKGGQVGAFNNTYLGQTGSVAYAIQGNVLTGAPVVDQAVLAAINTPGDLPEKLMASMQAARLMGGDGRCSCAPSTPTACGAPPPSFTKSAHIAYMLIARAGDADGGNGIYRVGGLPYTVAAADLNNDGRPELIATNSSTSSVSVLPNKTPPNAGFPIFNLSTAFPTGALPRPLVVTDVTGDGLHDLVVGEFNTNTVSVLPGLGGGAFGPRAIFPAITGPHGLAVAQFDGAPGLDIAVANQTSNNISMLLNNGSGGFTPGVAVPVAGGPYAIAAAQFIGGPALDLAVVSRTGASLTMLEGDGAGGFTVAWTVPIGANPSSAVAADLDGDLDTDLVVANQAGGIFQVFHNSGGFLFPTTIPTPFTVFDADVGDVDGDGFKDILAAGSSKFSIYRGGPGGTLTLDRTYTVLSTLIDAILADLDGDGDLDVAGSNGQSVVVVRNQGPGPDLGVFDDGLGTATGDYFMEFNIAFQSITAPDPVLQLQTLYDTWRSDLVGRPDAVQSLVTMTPAVIAPGGAATMTILLRDHQGQAITVPIGSFVVAHAPNSAGQSTIGPITNLGGGMYSVPLTGGASVGLDRFRVTLTDGIRPVTLMPDPRLGLGSPCYANCNGDFDPITGAPILNLADFGCFQSRFALGDPWADCNGDGLLNLADFGCWRTKFALGCP